MRSREELGSTGGMGRRWSRWEHREGGEAEVSLGAYVHLHGPLVRVVLDVVGTVHGAPNVQGMHFDGWNSKTNQFPHSEKEPPHLRSASF